MHQGEPSASPPLIQLSGLAPSWTETHVRLVCAIFGGAAVVRLSEGNAGNSERVAQVLLKNVRPENIAKAMFQLNNAVVGDDLLLEECTLSCSVVANDHLHQQINANAGKFASNAAASNALALHNIANSKSNHVDTSTVAEKKKMHMGRFIQQQDMLLQKINDLGQQQSASLEEQASERRALSELLSLLRPMSLSGLPRAASPEDSNHVPKPLPGPMMSETKVAPADDLSRSNNNEHSLDSEGDVTVDEREPEFSVWHFLTHKNQTSIVSVILLLMYMSAGVGFFVGFEDWPVGNTLYFAVVCLTTVGYGDYLPTTDRAKLFTCFYVIFGLVIAACAVSNIADTLTAWATQQMKFERQECLFERNKHKKLKRRRAFLKDLCYFVFVLAVGMNFFANAKDWEVEDPDGNKWINSLYLSVITLTTIGFGDLTPTSDHEKAFTVVYMVIGIPVFGTCLNAFTNFFFGDQKDQIKLTLIQGGATPDNFNRMLKFRQKLNAELGCWYDPSHKRIDRFQFLACVLIQNGLLDMDHIKRAMRNFEQMDTVRDGFITMEDVDKHYRKKLSSEF